MITQIYSPILIPLLEEKIPMDIHTVIGGFLGYSKHMFIYINLIYNSKVTDVIKRYIYYNCFTNYKLYDYTFDVQSPFEKLVVENLHNIVEVHRIMPLFYRRHNTSTIDQKEWRKIDNYLTNGYEVRESFDLVECDVFKIYKLQKKPIVENITEQQTICAFIAQLLDFHEVKTDDSFHIEFNAYYKRPSCGRLNKYIEKNRIKSVMYVREYVDEIGLLEEIDENIA